MHHITATVRNKNLKKIGKTNKWPVDGLLSATTPVTITNDANYTAADGANTETKPAIVVIATVRVSISTTPPPRSATSTSTPPEPTQNTAAINRL